MCLSHGVYSVVCRKCRCALLDAAVALVCVVCVAEVGISPEILVIVVGFDNLLVVFLSHRPHGHYYIIVAYGGNDHAENAY